MGVTYLSHGTKDKISFAPNPVLQQLVTKEERNKEKHASTRFV
jgi:hypothetical protein